MKRMGLETLTLRPFCRQDAIDIEGGVLDIPTAGNTAVIDGKPVAYAGVYKMALYPGLGGRDFVFFHVSACELGQLLRTKAPLFIHRVIVDALKAILAGDGAEDGIKKVHVLCDEASYPSSPKWLAALGFAPMRDDDKPFDILVLEAHLGGVKTWVKSSE